MHAWQGHNLTVMVWWVCTQVAELLRVYLAKFQLAPEFTEEEIRHYLVPQDGVIDAYVVADEGVASFRVEDSGLCWAVCKASARPLPEL